MSFWHATSSRYSTLFPDIAPSCNHTFMHGAWERWDRLSQGHRAGQHSVKVSMTRSLSEVSTMVMLGYREMYKRAKYVLATLNADDSHDRAYFAYFADSTQPEVYGIQYISGEFGIGLTISTDRITMEAGRVRCRRAKGVERQTPPFETTQAYVNSGVGFACN